MIKWSDNIAQIARQTERNLSSKSIVVFNIIFKGLDAYEQPNGTPSTGGYTSQNG